MACEAKLPDSFAPSVVHLESTAGQFSPFSGSKTSIEMLQLGSTMASEHPSLRRGELIALRSFLLCLNAQNLSWTIAVALQSNILVEL